jgi:hypothetical protein
MAVCNDEASERRQTPRYPIDPSATLVLPGQSSCPGAIADLSLGGTLFVPHRRPDAQVGMHGVFCLSEPHAEVETVVRIARMAAVEQPSISNADGLGLQFVSPSHTTRGKLDRLTKLAS